MWTQRLRAIPFLAAGALVLLSGCTSGEGEPPAPLPGSGGETTDQEYPEGPYGTSIGKIIRNFDFPGYARPATGIGADAKTTIYLGDYFNPTGEGTYPEGSPFGEGVAKPRALVINVSAGWCGPCKLEAQKILPDEYAHYQPLGAELMVVLADGNESGVAAEAVDLDNWVSSFDVDYPAVLDPSYQLGGLFDTSLFPANMIIDPRDMSIVEIVTGVPQKSFWDRVDVVLDGK